MHEFQTFCYLDVPKTGSTFVSAFLEEHIAEPLLRKKKHGRISDDGKEGEKAKLHFITVREPLDHYLSLYFHGARGRGMLRRKLDENGFGSLYGEGPQAFSDWLVFMLDPANAPHLGEKYAEAAPELYGFQTFRHLALAFRKPMAKLKLVSSRDVLREIYADKKLVSRVLRTESLNADLRALVESDLRHAVKDIDAALAALPPERAEQRDALEAAAAAAVAALPPELRARLEDREWFVYDVIGYPRVATAAGVSPGGAS